MNLLFASQNVNKIAEIQAKLPTFRIEGLDPHVFPNELEETGATLDENALQKARQVFVKTGQNCFADDTGLEVEALGGEPGVYSARYAGEQRSSTDNMQLLLLKLADSQSRKAQFRTVIALILEGKEYLFEGICEGTITTHPRGDHGFGYDPIFIPDGNTKSFADISLEEKNKVSQLKRLADIAKEKRSKISYFFLNSSCSTSLSAFQTNSFFTMPVKFFVCFFTRMLSNFSTQ
jgi:XTP/dITP diphosphohydrolase